ncbi:MAG: 6-phosphogluconolactonase [Acidobacteriota bacterium]
MRADGNILIARDLSELITEFKKIFVELYSAAVADKGSFTISLSGGSTPKAIYRELIGLDVDWSKVYFFFGDERCVPSTDNESNFHMASGAFLSPLGIPADHIFRWQTELGDPEKIAADYGSRLSEFFGGMPRLDLFLLGMGPDAHTASLFPETSALHETEKIAVANWVPKFNAFRLTLTPPVINNSANILFIVTGPEKADALRTVLTGEHRPDSFPAQLIKPTSGSLRWFIDGPAAAGLRPA